MTTAIQKAREFARDRGVYTASFRSPERMVEACIEEALSTRNATRPEMQAELWSRAEQFRRLIRDVDAEPEPIVALGPKHDPVQTLPLPLKSVAALIRLHLAGHALGQGPDTVGFVQKSHTGNMEGFIDARNVGRKVLEAFKLEATRECILIGAQVMKIITEGRSYTLCAKRLAIPARTGRRKLARILIQSLEEAEKVMAVHAARAA